MTPDVPTNILLSIRSNLHSDLTNLPVFNHLPHKIQNDMIIHGKLTFLLAIENNSLILAAPLFSLSVNSAPEAKTKGNPLSLASVLAKRVFPVPGGPDRSTPCMIT